MTLGGFLERAETPEILKLFIQNDLQITTVSDLLGYVAKNTYEDEWKDIITGHFVLRQPRAAVPATTTTRHPITTTITSALMSIIVLQVHMKRRAPHGWIAGVCTTWCCSSSW